MKVKFLFLLPTLVALSACSSLPHNSTYFHTNKQSYLNAQNLPETNIPQGLSDSKFNNYYQIPNVPGTVNGPLSLVPPGSLAAQQAAK